MPSGRMVRVLGPVDVVSGGRGVSVGGPHARALLSALVIGVGHAVPVDQLDEVLWGDAPPPSADSSLQAYVSRLRNLLGTDAIVRTDHSYELTLGINEVDALLFDSLLTRAHEAREDPEACRAYCREALHLWRGQPFGDLADEEPFRLEANRLEELRLTTIELSYEAELALGQHRMVVGELEGAVEEHPYRETLWLLLARALAGSGRRVEALRECARLRRVLADVGVQASDELTSLEQEILAGHRTGIGPST